MPYSAAAQFEHEEIAPAPRGWKIRTTTTPGGDQIRIAFPPGRRRRGAGQVISILHAKNPGPSKPVDQITDRAKRYRANASPPLGPRVCEICGSTRFLVIDHRDGDESNNRQSNKRWLCKSHNTQLGAEDARKGRGVRTRQFNPDDKAIRRAIKGLTTEQLEQVIRHKDRMYDLSRQEGFDDAAATDAAYTAAIRLAKQIKKKNPGARTLAQYTEAAYYHQRGAHDWGGSVIHETPIAHRRAFAAEIWRRRRGEAPERVKLNPLPLEEAAARYEQFHGRTPRQILDAQRSDAVRKTYWALGPLDELEIAGPDCDLEAIDFAGLDPEAKLAGAIPLDFQGDGTELAADPRGHQLYLIGGDQALDAEDLSYFGADTKKDQVLLGPVVSLTYEARKPPDFQRARYRHFLGEHSGEQPLAFYDRIKGEIALVGGRYRVKDWIYD